MSEWIDKAKQKPAKADEDQQGCVLVWHRYNHVMVYRRLLMINNDYITHWMRCPEEPGEEGATHEDDTAQRLQR